MRKSSKKRTRPTRKLGLPPGSLVHIGEIKTEKPSITLIEFDARGVTEADTTLLVVPNEDFQALLGEQAFRAFVFQLFSERIADLMQLIEEVAFRKLDQRLAALLLGKGQRLHTTHQQLADELGSVREIVSRLLKGLAEQGLVALSREQIEILDPAGLRRLAGG